MSGLGTVAASSFPVRAAEDAPPIARPSLWWNLIGLEKSVFVAALLWLFGLGAWSPIPLWAALLFGLAAMRAAPRWGDRVPLIGAAQLLAALAMPGVVVASLGAW